MSRFHAKLPSKRWENFRRRILERDNWTCRECRKYGHHVDHIRPLHKGGDPWAADNVQVLCWRCHVKKTRQENRRKLTPAEAEWAAFADELKGIT